MPQLTGEVVLSDDPHDVTRDDVYAEIERTGQQSTYSQLDGRLSRFNARASFATYRNMRKDDPTIWICRQLASAPVTSASWGVEEKDYAPAGAADLISDIFLPLRLDFLTHAVLGNCDYGFQGFESVWGADCNSQVRIKKLKPLLPDLTEILINPKTGEFAGYVQVDAYGVDQFLYVPQAFHTVLNYEGTDWYGEPDMEIVRGCYNDWKTINRAAERYDRKVAGSHWIVHFPNGTSLVRGAVVDNLDVAKGIINTLQASGAVAIPSTLTEFAADLSKDSKEAWRIELLSDAQGSKAAFIDRMKYLDALKARGFCLPERAIQEGNFGTKAEAEAHANFGISLCERKHKQLVQLLNRGPVNQVLVTNYGKAFADSVYLEPAPLTDMSRQVLIDIYKIIMANPQVMMAELERLDMGQFADRLNLPVRPVNDDIDLTDAALPVVDPLTGLPQPPVAGVDTLPIAASGFDSDEQRRAFFGKFGKDGPEGGKGSADRAPGRKHPGLHTEAVNAQVKWSKMDRKAQGKPDWTPHQETLARAMYSELSGEEQDRITKESFEAEEAEKKEASEKAHAEYLAAYARANPPRVDSPEEVARKAEDAERLARSHADIDATLAAMRAHDERRKAEKKAARKAKKDAKKLSLIAASDQPRDAIGRFGHSIAGFADRTPASMRALAEKLESREIVMQTLADTGRETLLPYTPDTDDEKVARIKSGVFKSHTVQDVPLDKIDTNQRYISEEKITEMAEMNPARLERTAKREPISVVPKGNGRYLLVDGNHRTNIAVMEGKASIRAAVFNGEKKELSLAESFTAAFELPDSDFDAIAFAYADTLELYNPDQPRGPDGRWIGAPGETTLPAYKAAQKLHKKNQKALERARASGDAAAINDAQRAFDKTKAEQVKTGRAYRAYLKAAKIAAAAERAVEAVAPPSLGRRLADAWTELEAAADEGGERWERAEAAAIAVQAETGGHGPDFAEAQRLYRDSVLAERAAATATAEALGVPAEVQTEHVEQAQETVRAERVERTGGLKPSMVAAIEAVPFRENARNYDVHWRDTPAPPETWDIRRGAAGARDFTANYKFPVEGVEGNFSVNTNMSSRDSHTGMYITFNDPSGSYQATDAVGTKAAIKVFDKVGASLIALARKESPDVLKFSAAPATPEQRRAAVEAGRTPESANSRQRLYDRLSRDFVKANPEYTAVAHDEFGTKIYHVVKREKLADLRRNARIEVPTRYEELTP